LIYKRFEDDIIEIRRQQQWGDSSGEYAVGDPSREIVQREDIYAFGVTMMLK